MSLPPLPDHGTAALLLAAKHLGIAKDTAYRLAAEDGELCEGVPVIKVGGKSVVPVIPLRRKLGYDVSAPTAAAELDHAS